MVFFHVMWSKFENSKNSFFLTSRQHRVKIGSLVLGQNRGSSTSKGSYQ